MRAVNEPITQELPERLARLEERMNTNQAKYEGALERLRVDLVERENRQIKWQIGLAFAGVLITIASLGLIIRISI